MVASWSSRFRECLIVAVCVLGVVTMALFPTTIRYVAVVVMLGWYIKMSLYQKMGLLLFLVMSIPEGSSFGNSFRFGESPLTIHDVLFMIIVLDWWFRRISRRTRRVISEVPFEVLARSLFLLYMLISGTIGLAKGVPIRAFLYDIHIPVFYIIIDIMRDERLRGKSVAPYLLGGVVFHVILVVVLGIIAPNAVITHGMRAASRNDLTLVLLMPMLLTNARLAKGPQSLPWVCGAILAVGKVFASMTRGAYVLLVASALCYIAVRMVKGRFSDVWGFLRIGFLTVVVFCVVGVFLLAALPGASNAFLKHLSSRVGEALMSLSGGYATVRSLKVKVLDMQNVWRLAQQSLLLGIGVGARFKLFDPNALQSSGLYIDNLLLTYLAKLGLVGTSLFLLVLGTWFFGVLRRYLAHDRLESYGAQVGMEVAALVFLLLSPLVMFLSSSMGYYRQMLVVLAVVAEALRGGCRTGCHPRWSQNLWNLRAVPER